MKINRLLSIAAAVTATVLPLVPAHADSIMYDTISVIAGQQSSVESFDITQAGTLTVSLGNIPWLDTVTDMSLFMSNASSTLGSTMTAAGTESMSVAPGTIYSHFFGDADGSYGLGAYSLKISFQPASSGAVVPLPASLLLLLSGLGLLFGWQRRERTLAPPSRWVRPRNQINDE